MNNYSVSIRVGVSRIFLTLAKFWVMFILWINAARAVLVTARRGVVFSLLFGFIILIIYTSNSAPDLSTDELVALNLKDKNENSDFAIKLTLLNGKVNKNNFEECMKSSKPIAPTPSGSTKQMFRDEGAPEGTDTHQVLKTSLKFNYQNVLGELMYVYINNITCRPDIGYGITTLSKSSLEPSAFHYKLFCGVAKYLRSIITWGISFNQPFPLNLDKFYESVLYLSWTYKLWWCLPCWY